MVFNNSISLMDVFKKKSSNFTPDEHHIVAFQTPRFQPVCRGSK
jgi:hypothetical protein